MAVWWLPDPTGAALTHRAGAQSTALPRCSPGPAAPATGGEEGLPQPRGLGDNEKEEEEEEEYKEQEEEKEEKE